MPEKFQIRRYAEADEAPLWLLVDTVTAETYGRILPEGFAPDRDTDWQPAWIAEDSGAIVAVMLTGADWLDDLWIAATHRSQGLGGRLLDLAEAEIAARGHRLARLRLVVVNARALRFYSDRGWRENRRYLHERLGLEMVEMTKAVALR